MMEIFSFKNIYIFSGRVQAPGRVKRAQTDHVPCSGVLPHEQPPHTDGHRPGFDRHDFSPDREILSYVDGTVDCVVPNRRIVSTIHDIYLYFHGSGQWRKAFVLGRGFQLVRLSLNTRVEKKKQ